MGLVTFCRLLRTSAIISVFTNTLPKLSRQKSQALSQALCETVVPLLHATAIGIYFAGPSLSLLESIDTCCSIAPTTLHYTDSLNLCRQIPLALCLLADKTEHTI
ncbi:hypothetical protein NPIL_167151 [Nephila pilipes]|uniref:Uncharacterized protein n=1 Tax=Nephila pilipes TaxID=299642 RepID=A0A8X6NQ09_NEPPI|nr:hypothetical protein NPIL_167151 [Nephila pilipes]